MALRRLLRGPWLLSNGHRLELMPEMQVLGCTPSVPSTSASCDQQRSMSRTVDMVLIKDHPHLGKTGEVVKVKAGHARLDLYPKQLAVYATKDNLKRYAKTQHQQEEAAAARGLTLDDILNKLATSNVVASRRAAPRGAEEQHMVGQVSKADIAELVRQQLHIELPPSQILMDSAIRQYGSFRVPTNLRTTRGKQVELRLEVSNVRKMR